MEKKHYYVYLLASGKHGTQYIGVTSDLIKRTHTHREKVAEGFTSKYGINKLVYFEMHDDVEEAIRREKQLKKWNRDWKVRLIEENNPGWDDLYLSLAA